MFAGKYLHSTVLRLFRYKRISKSHDPQVPFIQLTSFLLHFKDPEQFAPCRTLKVEDTVIMQFSRSRILMTVHPAVWTKTVFSRQLTHLTRAMPWLTISLVSNLYSSADGYSYCIMHQSVTLDLNFTLGINPSDITFFYPLMPMLSNRPWPSASSFNRLPCEKHQMFGLLLFAVWQGSLSNETLTWNKQTDRLSRKRLQ